jgi:cyclase
MRVIAKLDVKPPYVVKPIHFEGLRKIGTPAELSGRYYQQGADEILYIDIVASLYRREVLFDQIEAVSQQLFVPLGVGGGVRSIDDISRLFHCGADKVTLNTHVLQHNPELIDQAARTFGSQAVVLALEAKRWNGWWECYSDCGRERSGKDVIAWVQEAERRGAGEVLVQSVDCDGRRQGFDIPLLLAVRQAVAIPMIAASGAGSVGDVVTMARQVRPDAVAIASLLHYELATIVELKAALAEEGL